MIKVDKGITIPANVSREKYPWKKMEVGDSFLVTDAKIRLIQGNARMRNRRHPDTSFVVRQTADGVRVWRVK